MTQTRISINEKTVTKIITNKTTGIISKHWTKGRHLQYIGMVVETGSTAPTLSQIEINGFNIFPGDDEQSFLNSNVAVDIYVYCNMENNKNDIGYLIVSI